MSTAALTRRSLAGRLTRFTGSTLYVVHSRIKKRGKALAV